ncbi:hypothetical protein HDU82_004252 [Entophlyctis luteolus]|nr:hypothetical protein HDU82_004252 [Entophlyctis luteolus]
MSSRSLKARHLEMIAIGGTIGAGLLKRSGKSIATAGPVGALLCFIIVGIQVYSVTTSIAEMATLIPISGAMSSLPARFLNKSIGFGNGLWYGIGWAITVPTELAAVCTLMTYWVSSSQFPVWAWSIIFAVPLLLSNVIHVKGFGETEFVLAIIKVIAVIIFIIFGIAVWLGAGSSGPLGFRNWNPAIVGATDTARFSNFASAFSTAFYAYSGTELVALTSAEASNVRKSIPRAVNGSFYRIAVLYIGSIFLVGVILNPASTTLLGSSIANSPFVFVYQQVGIGAAADIMNAVIVIALASAGNSAIFASSRSLYGLALQGDLPRFFAQVTSAGIPLNAMLVSFIFGVIGIVLNFVSGAENVFTGLSSLGSINTTITWLIISWTHLRFRQGYIHQGYDLKDLPYRAPFYPYTNYLSILISIVVLISVVFAAFYNVTVYDVNWIANHTWLFVGVPLLLGFALFHALYTGWKSGNIASAFNLVSLPEMDFKTDRFVETEEEKKDSEIVTTKPKTLKEWWAKVQYKLF